jgi:hypothetical protein
LQAKTFAWVEQLCATSASGGGRQAELREIGVIYSMHYRILSTQEEASFNPGS